MKKTQFTPQRLLVVILWISFALMLQGCPQPVHMGSASSGYESPEPEPQKKSIPNSSSDPFAFEKPRKQYIPPPPETIEEADRIVARNQKMIRDLQVSKREHQRWEVYRGYQDASSAGAVKLTGGPEYADLRDQHAAQIVGHEREIVRLKKVIKQAKATKAEMLDQSVGCFLPNTLVQMGDGSFKPFVEVIPGDKVMSYDIGHDKQVSRSVVELYSVESNHLYKINNEFETTGGERLLTQNGWKEINRLKKGDIIHVNGKMVEVFAIEFKRTNHTLHNMQVNNTHNFYVSTANGTKYLVHNCGGGGK
ncbi:MAG: hypothetical protein J7K90_01650 [Desulfuromusa sp.]|nr:hypothetical protein [Desulfuromusa sp.]